MPDFSAGVFFRMATDPVVRLWGGDGDFILPQDGVETAASEADRVYKGIGILQDIPAVQQLINGLADRLTFTLSGVSPEVLRLAEQDADEVRGARVNLGFIRLDADLQPVLPMLWLWEGEADVVPVSRTSQGDGSAIRTIGISVGTMDTNRKRPKFETYTPINQKRRSPTDKFCDFVPLYNAGSTKKWG